MKNINRVQLLGYLGADPDSRQTNGGKAVVNLSVATTDRYTDRQSGDKLESTEWHRVVAFGKTAELLGERVHKGSLVMLEGKLRTRKWTDQEGQDQWTTEVVADDFIAFDKSDTAARAT